MIDYFILYHHSTSEYFYYKRIDDTLYFWDSGWRPCTKSYTKNGWSDEKLAGYNLKKITIEDLVLELL